MERVKSRSMESTMARSRSKDADLFHTRSSNVMQYTHPSSTSLPSSVEGLPLPARNRSLEKVEAWLQEKVDDTADNRTGTPTFANSKGDTASPVGCRKKTKSPLKEKVQNLLRYGEYSLLKKWIVLVEGDFLQCNSTNNQATTDAAKGTPVRKRRKTSLRDVRSLALTKNWLIICHMAKLYHVEEDGIEPCGISLHIHRLVPLKYLEITISRPEDKVIAIKNQQGLIKEYQLIVKPLNNEDTRKEFCRWCKVIKSLRPRHSDDTLYETLRLFQRWTTQHACRITIHPGTASNTKSLQANRSDHDWSSSLPPTPASRSNASPPPPVTLSGNPAPSTKREVNDDTSEDQGTEEEGIKPTRQVSFAETNQHISLTPEYQSYSDASYHVTGKQVVIGSDHDMTLSSASDEEIPGKEMTVGTGRAISPPVGRDDNPQGDGGGTSDTKKKRSSFKDKFKIFKNKEKRRSDVVMQPTKGAADVTAPASTTKLRQRRMSRLDMNEPIEDVFADLKFDRLESQPRYMPIPAEPDEPADDLDIDDVILEQRATSGSDAHFSRGVYEQLYSARSGYPSKPLHDLT